MAKDACYRKVKARYKVFPSAYASGAIAKCRKKGAKNWGNKILDGSTQDREGTSSEEVVQGKVGRCPLWKALWTTTGRKARHALLQTIKACDKQNSCDCWGDVRVSQAVTHCSKETIRSTSRETKEGKS